MNHHTRQLWWSKTGCMLDMWEAHRASATPYHLCYCHFGFCQPFRCNILAAPWHLLIWPLSADGPNYAISPPPNPGCWLTVKSPLRAQWANNFHYRNAPWPFPRSRPGRAGNTRKKHSLKIVLYILQHASCQKESVLILLEELPSRIPTLEVQLAPQWWICQWALTPFAHRLPSPPAQMGHTSKLPCLVLSQAPFSYRFDLVAEEVYKGAKETLHALRLYQS